MAKNLILANIGEDSYLFHSWEEFYKATFSPADLEKVTFVRDFSISGKTYAERKENARNLACDIQGNEQGSLSWAEYAEIGEYFNKIGKRYGLLREFEENGI